MAVINFEDYKVTKMQFIENDDFELKQQSEPIELDHEINFNIYKKDNLDEAIVELTIKVGGLDLDVEPFFLTVTIKGIFTFNASEDKLSNGFDTYLKGNALAILFPYVRQIISMLTSMSNSYPTYIMPTINIVKVLEEMENSNSED